MIGLRIPKPIEDLQKYSQAAAWCNASRLAYIEDCGDYYEVVALPELTEAEIIDVYKVYVQAALDSFAATRGYDDIHTAASYNTSSDAQFALEGKYCDELRTTTWRQCWDILAKVKAGEMPQPTKEELVAMLPIGSAKWPDEA